MATKADRGTKRTCQDASCGLRFYDLARDPITCPTCGAAYKIVVAAPAAIRRPQKKFEYGMKTPLPVEAEKDAPDIVADESEDAADDAIILEEEEEDGDVSEIVEGPAKDET